MNNSFDKEHTQGQTPTLVLHPYLKIALKDKDRSVETRLEEAKGLAMAIALRVEAAYAVPLADIRPATYLGKGKVEELKTVVEAAKIALVIMDTHLSPVQQRNLERAWGCKVIDRTALILEIFGERARTREGTLQVELAALDYQKSRLVRSWTHLERQRGGFGFLGGPGESQIEIDRRLISERITKIKKELESVRKMRELHRKARSKVPYPIVALVGYTNAGKSTLFNHLTGAQVVAEDKLFATLDPTMRVVKLPLGSKVILSDTVGFISDLPTELVAAFRATLEEVVEADVILHVRDIVSPETEAQKRDVETVLEKLGVKDKLLSQTIEVLNKADLLEEEKRENLTERAGRQEKMAVISALTGNGVGALLHVVEKMLSAKDHVTQLCIDASDGKMLSWLYAHGEVLERADEENHITLTVRLSGKYQALLESMR